MVVDGNLPFMEWTVRSVGSSFLRTPGACVVNDDLPHRAGGNRQEMGPVTPARAIVIDQLQVGRVDQSVGAGRPRHTSCCRATCRSSG